MSASLWTGRAGLRWDGTQLVGENGGWLNEGGTVDGYLFRFVRDGVWASCPVPPGRESHDAARARLAGNSNVFRPPAGGSWVVEVYAVSFSGAWGDEPAWAEWGGRNAANRQDPSTFPNRSPAVTVPASVPPPPPSAPVTIPRDALLADVRELEMSLGYKLGWGRVVRPTRRLRGRL